MKKKLLPPDKPGMMRLMFTLLFIGLLSVANAQTTVTGTVTDEESKPVSGATVTVKGTVTSVATDASGKFSINAPGTGTLVISYRRIYYPGNPAQWEKHSFSKFVSQRSDCSY